MIRACPVCGAKNRIPARHLSDTGRCGSCKARLAPLAEPLEVDAATFDEIVREAPVPVLVDFWAAWCGPCRAAAPEVQALARSMSGRAIVLKVDTEQNQDLAARFRVQSIPNFLVLRNGQKVFQQAGLVRSDQMRQWLETAASAA
jgi:thioredoxin 2